jgi:NAD(P)H-hydrate epimerase
MERLDLASREKKDISPLVLMENAGQKSFIRLRSVFEPLVKRTVLVVAGEGNNGGDGSVLARCLLQEGIQTFLYLAGKRPGKFEARTNFEIYRKMGGPIYDGETGSEAIGHLIAKSDIIIDAIFGTGLSRPVSHSVGETIRAINNSEKPVVSLDIPSGVSADNGRILGEAVRSAFTFTYGLPKLGHFLYPGSEYCGKLFVEDIGIPRELVEQADIRTELLEAETVRGLLPARRKNAHKGNFGHLMILAGSRGKRGAGALSCKGALRSGAGLVTWALPEELDRPDPFIPEVMTFPLPQKKSGALDSAGVTRLLAALENKDAFAIGPGLGTQPETRKFLKSILPKVKVPVILDADALNLLAGEERLFKSLKNPVLLTPHPGEMGRLCSVDATTIQGDRIRYALNAAKGYGGLVLLKGANTLIVEPNESVWINPTGNPGMATAGTGDVLTGMIGALVAQGHSLLNGALAGAFLHGLAGDLACEDKGETGMIATDLIEKIPDAYRKITLGTGRA